MTEAVVSSKIQYQFERVTRPSPTVRKSMESPGSARTPPAKLSSIMKPPTSRFASAPSPSGHKAERQSAWMFGLANGSEIWVTLSEG